MIHLMKNREELITARLSAHYDYIKSMGHEIVGIFLQGSQNYNLDIYDDDYQSDVDTKCLVIPTLKDLIKGNKMVSKKYDFEGEQIDVKDIRVMMEMWRKQNSSYLEILFTNYYLINPKYQELIDELLTQRNDLSHMNEPQLIRCICGMAKEKVIALEHPYPSTIEKIKKYGYDPKQLASIIRLYHLSDNLFRKRIDFKQSMTYDRDSSLYNFMISVKKGNFPLEEAREMAKEYMDSITNIKESIVEQYGKENFISETYDKLKDTIYKIVYLGIASSFDIVYNDWR